MKRRYKPAAVAQSAGMGFGQVGSRVVCVWCEESLSTKLVLADHVRAIHLDFHVSFCDKCNQYSSARKYRSAHQCVGYKA
ncbi:hypothetical protein BJ165DRAFT_1449975 [Panaeolus papilionaceus]|nr:hypothetical protein BJ165DRAFT_1449975 [Panaeolus papilionaceus]